TGERMLARFEGTDDVVQTRQIGHFSEVSLRMRRILSDRNPGLTMPPRTVASAPNPLPGFAHQQRRYQ
ncbi:MAG: hypothetical protein WCE38_03520, partial [Burkholderiales bacterium]